MLNIALPKGRLGSVVYELFDKIGYGCAEMNEDSRKLVFEDEEHGVRYLLVKPSDVAIYVERGAADIGVAGKDKLMESDPDVFELLDLKIGVCRVAIASMRNWSDDVSLPLRVATTYPNITHKFFAKENRQIEIIRLSGSVELAPILGLSDVIVDIVETGATLRENDLVIRREIATSSAMLIANKSSYQFAGSQINSISEKIKGTML